MSVNRGKDFEKAVREGFLKINNVSIDRVPDQAFGFLGAVNICDFVVYRYPFLYYLECKAIHTNTFNLNAMITKGQWEGLTEKSKLDGIVAGFLIWYISHDKTIFITIQELTKLKNLNKKSLNIKDIIDNKVKYIEVKGIKKRILYDYDMRDFLYKVEVIACQDE